MTYTNLLDPVPYPCIGSCSINLMLSSLSGDRYPSNFEPPNRCMIYPAKGNHSHVRNSLIRETFSLNFYAQAIFRYFVVCLPLSTVGPFIRVTQESKVKHEATRFHLITTTLHKHRSCNQIEEYIYIINTEIYSKKEDSPEERA